MTENRWERVGELLEAALERAPEERSGFVERACADDPDLLTEVLELVAAAETTAELPAVGPLDAAAGGNVDSPGATEVPRHQLLEVLGDGGMGTVWIAEQLEPVRRRVAVKLLKPGLDSSDVLARFDAERQALAQMDHPHIAKVFDAGLTGAGRPFFSMELVDGTPLDLACDRERRSVEERIGLFLQVCSAVQHAHQKGVVHRDLKPSNLLVGQVDGRPQVKVIDFGIAKAIGPETGRDRLETVHGVFLGTPEYMSPEQAGTGSGDVDTRADVYALGVVLYELLAGSLPLSSELFRSPSGADVRRILETTDPPRPSARLASLPPTERRAIEERRRCPRGTLERVLRGDLDWIVLRALEKDRERRYSTVAELAADLERFLRHEPVAAGPPSGAYRLRKWLRRHRVAAAIGGVAATAAILFGSALALQARRLADARDEAEAALRRSRAVSSFLANVFTLTDPGSTDAQELSAGELLARGVERIGEDLENDPRTRADLLDVLADVHARLGRLDQARELATRAVDLRRSTAGRGRELELAESLTRLGVIEARSQRFDEAGTLLEEGLAIRRRATSDGSLEAADSLGALGRLALQRGAFEEALTRFRESAAIRRPLEAPPSEEQIAMLGNAGGMLVRLGRHAEARAPLEEALALVRRHYPDNRRLVFGLQNSLVSVERETGRPEAVVALARSNLELGLAMYGEKHPWVLTAYATLASELGRAGRNEEAIELAEKAYVGNREAFGAASPRTLGSRARLARLLGGLDRNERCVETAEVTLGQLDELAAGATDEAPRLTLNRWEVTQILGQCLTALGRLANGESALRRSLVWSAALPGGGSEEAQSRFALGVNLRQQGRFEEAEAELEAGWSGLRGSALESPEIPRELAALYDAWGRPEKAARYRELAASTTRGTAAFR